MARKFSFRRGGEARLEIDTLQGGGLRVSLDGKPVRDFATARELQRGAWVDLPDDTQLFVQIRLQMLLPGLLLVRNGQLLPDCDFDPERVQRMAAMIVAAVGALSLAMGVVLLVRGLFPRSDPGLATRSITAGATMLVLAAGVRARRWGALPAAIVVFVLSSGWNVYQSTHAGRAPQAVPVVFGIAVAAMLVRAWTYRAPALPVPPPPPPRGKRK